MKYLLDFFCNNYLHNSFIFNKLHACACATPHTHACIIIIFSIIIIIIIIIMLFRLYQI